MAKDDKPRNFGSRLSSRFRRNLNQMLDAVDDFEKRGGLSGFIDNTLDNNMRALPGQTEKSLFQYYANLEVPYGADLATIKKSYRRLLRKYHPDKHSGDPEREKLATELTQELTRAYTAVTNHLEETGRA